MHKILEEKRVERGRKSVSLTLTGYGELGIGVCRNGFHTTTINFDPETFSMLREAIEGFADEIEKWSTREKG